jgi:FKBP-type peptidyl-prolyl cis-trans isomerase
MPWIPADTAFQEAGLHLVVATMRCGEKCRIWAAPKYGYGERGNFSFPTVPPNADLM